jgi:hypothetical protein
MAYVATIGIFTRDHLGHALGSKTEVEADGTGVPSFQKRKWQYHEKKHDPKDAHPTPSIAKVAASKLT